MPQINIHRNNFYLCYFYPIFIPAKENVKTAGYSGVIIVGLGAFGAICYTIMKELFSSESPMVMFNNASDQCIAHDKVQDLLGEPIKAFGEENRRGRRRHVRFVR